MTTPETTTPANPTQVSLDALQQRIDAYVTAMNPATPVSTEEGVRAQTALWSIIRHVLSKTDGEFVVLYAKLLENVLTYRRTVFNERYVYRFFEHLRLSPNDRRNFERMLNLLLVTCDPKSRRLALRQVNLNTTVSGFADNNVQQRIIGFYSV